MKFVVISTFLLLGVSAMDEEFLKQTRARVRKAGEDCVVEEKAQMSDLDTIMNFQIPESHEGKCLLFCGHKKFNLQNADGTINNEGAMETFSIIKDIDPDFHAKVVDAFEHCIKIPSDPDPCVFSANLSICFLKKAKEEGIHELIME